VEALYLIDDNCTGLIIPKPPNLEGRASKFLSKSPGGDRPATAGIKLYFGRLGFHINV